MFFHSIKAQSEIYFKKEIQFINDCINQKVQHHPNILNFIDLIHLEDTNESFVIQEYCEFGNLYKFLLDSNELTQTDQIQICLQIARGVQWLHQQNIIHRDLKPDSILVTFQDNNNLFKITDFGYSCFSQNQIQSIIGTINYMAPEVLNQSPYSRPVDVWALGLIMFEVAYKKQFFQSKTVKDTAQQILQFKTLPNDNTLTQNHLYKVITQCLNPDPSQRIVIDQVINNLQELQLNKLENQTNEIRQIQNNSNNKFDIEFSQQYNHFFNPQVPQQEQQRQLQIQNQLTLTKFNDFMKRFSIAKGIAPQQKGFFEKFTSSKIAKFTLNQYHFSLVCKDKQKFYCSLFHFILCGKLLSCLEEQSQLSNQFQDDIADSFQEWVMKLIETSIQIDNRNQKDQFNTLYIALSQIAQVRDIYFRINTYVNWLEDEQYQNQSTKLASILYEQSQKQEKMEFLPNTYVQIIYGDYLSALILSTQGGLQDCFVYEENQSNTIIMQPAYLSSLQQIDQKPQNQEGGIKDLLHKFKSSIISEGFLNKTKEITKNIKQKAFEIFNTTFKTK